ncbi:MAG: D-alanine--D-alanine ligase [Planctomycetes bacterium]|nr:D-alanine--D-alanine ligase [Planctomycetota bacterium]MBU4398296.1 D-alanine--D-alanine ligase [Planctomycetota bacterium]
MQVAVLHNAVAADAPLEDQDTLVQVDEVRAALTRLGHRPTAVPCTLDLAAMRSDLARLGAEVAFNLVESLDGSDSLLYLPLAVLDSLGMPYAGSRTESMFLTSNKPLAKQRMRWAGLPTPDWIEDTKPQLPLAASHDASKEWIIKGVWEHGSDGMEDDALLKGPSPAELQRRLTERYARSGRRCFAERFVEGREFAVAMLAGRDGPETLPPAEIDFSAFPAGKPRLVGYRAKWSEDCFEYLNTPRRFDFDPSDRPLLDRLCGLAMECWRLFDLHGWVRVDFRVDASGQPWILEINANPCLSPDAGFAAMLRQASIPFDRAIERILEDVLCNDRPTD